MFGLKVYEGKRSVSNTLSSTVTPAHLVNVPEACTKSTAWSTDLFRRLSGHIEEHAYLIQIHPSGWLKSHRPRLQ